MSICRMLGIFFTLALTLNASATPRTVFIQLFEWSWNDVARECEIYLGPAGFSAVQVSPPQEHVVTPNGPWWERYQVVSYKINSRAGNEAEFADMVNRCHNAGVDVYADAILNHAAGFDNGIGFVGGQFSRFDYPGIYSFKDFHHCGRNGDDHIVNYNDLYEMQNCMLFGLADLATETPYVRNRLTEYLNHLLDLGVDGFRIDAAKHIPANDIKAITSRLKRPAYIFQEIIFNPNEGIKYSDYTPNGDVSAYGYPFSVAHAFKHKNTNVLFDIHRDLPRSEDSIVFLTNHDLERSHDLSSVLTFTRDSQLYLLAQIYMLAWPFGYPQLYSGYQFKSYDQGPPLDQNRKTIQVLDKNGNCQGPWTCEHRSHEVAAMVDFRNQTDKVFTLTNWWTNGADQLAFGRGQVGYVAINFSESTLTRTFKTSLPEGIYCNMMGSGYNIETRQCTQGFSINRFGDLNATLPPKSSIVLMRLASSNDIKKKSL